MTCQVTPSVANERGVIPICKLNGKGDRKGRNSMEINRRDPLYYNFTRLMIEKIAH